MKNFIWALIGFICAMLFIGFMTGCGTVHTVTAAVMAKKDSSGKSNVQTQANISRDSTAHAADQRQVQTTERVVSVTTIAGATEDTALSVNDLLAHPGKKYNLGKTGGLSGSLVYDQKTGNLAIQATQAPVSTTTTTDRTVVAHDDIQSDSRVKTEAAAKSNTASAAHVATKNTLETKDKQRTGIPFMVWVGLGLLVLVGLVLGIYHWRKALLKDALAKVEL